MRASSAATTPEPVRPPGRPGRADRGPLHDQLPEPALHREGGSARRV